MLIEQNNNNQFLFRYVDRSMNLLEEYYSPILDQNIYFFKIQDILDEGNKIVLSGTDSQNNKALKVYIFNKKANLLNNFTIDNTNYSRVVFFENQENDDICFIANLLQIVPTEFTSKLQICMVKNNTYSLLKSVSLSAQLKYIGRMKLYNANNNYILKILERSVYVQEGLIKDDIESKALGYISFSLDSLINSIDIEKDESKMEVYLAGNNQLIVNSNLHIESYIIYSLQGSIISKGLLKEEIDTSGFSPGMYLIHLYGIHGNLLGSEKFIIP